MYKEAKRMLKTWNQELSSWEVPKLRLLIGNVDKMEQFGSGGDNVRWGNSKKQMFSSSCKVVVAFLQLQNVIRSTNFFASLSLKNMSPLC